MGNWREFGRNQPLSYHRGILLEVCEENREDEWLGNDAVELRTGHVSSTIIVNDSFSDMDS